MLHKNLPILLFCYNIIITFCPIKCIQCYYIYFVGKEMHKKLRNIGNSWGLIIPISILDLLKVNPVIDEVELIVEKDKLTIQKYKKTDKDDLS